MQVNQEFTLDFFDFKLRKLSFHLFDIDRESKATLGIIAKNGPVTETKITRLGRRRIILSREIIRRRILITDLSSDFLTSKKGKKIGNLSGKQEKWYSLTFKGFLASLVETPIQENFWIKNYIKMIEKISDKQTAKIFLWHIYYSVASFFILHSNKKGALTDFNDPEEEFYDNYAMEDSMGNLLWKEQIKGIPEEFQDLLVESVIQFFVSCEVVGTLLKNNLQTSFLSVDKGDDPDFLYDEIVDNLFRRWMWSIFFAIDKTPKEIFEVYEKEEDDRESVPFNIKDTIGDEPWDNISFMAADTLNKIKPELKIDRTQYVNGIRGYNTDSLFMD